jgi:hypothetical protein
MWYKDEFSFGVLLLCVDFIFIHDYLYHEMVMTHFSILQRDGRSSKFSYIVVCLFHAHCKTWQECVEGEF